MDFFFRLMNVNPNANERTHEQDMNGEMCNSNSTTIATTTTIATG